MAKAIKSHSISAKKNGGASALTSSVKWRFRRAVKYPAALFARPSARPTIIKHVA